jgi:hypothetical protein
VFVVGCLSYLTPAEWSRISERLATVLRQRALSGRLSARRKRIATTAAGV